MPGLRGRILEHHLWDGYAATTGGKDIPCYEAAPLRHGALDFPPPVPVGLVPLPVCHADQAALDRDHGHAYTGPEDQQVDLVFTAAVADVDRIGRDAVIGKVALQRLPHGPSARGNRR